MTKRRGIAIFPPRGVAVHIPDGVDPASVPVPAPPSREASEAAARQRARRRDARDRLIRPLQCRGGLGKGAGPRCRLRIAGLVWSEDEPRYPVLNIRGPWDRDGDSSALRFVLTGDPIPGTAMNVKLAALAPTDVVTITCSCGQVNRLHVAPLKRLAQTVAVR